MRDIDAVIIGLGGVRVTQAYDATFFCYDPDGDLPDERLLPFATVVTGTTYDTASKLDAPEDYRLNIGLTKSGFLARFGDADAPDHAARDVLMPHPDYAPQHWVCVVNPENTMDDVRLLLGEAHAFAARKYANARARRTP